MIHGTIPCISNGHILWLKILLDCLQWYYIASLPTPLTSGRRKIDWHCSSLKFKCDYWHKSKYIFMLCICISKMNWCIGILSCCGFGVARWIGVIDSLHLVKRTMYARIGHDLWAMQVHDLRWSIGVACDTHMISQR